MALTTRPLAVLRTEAVSSTWERRRDIPLAILAWTALVCLVLWGVGHIVRTLLILAPAGFDQFVAEVGEQAQQLVLPEPVPPDPLRVVEIAAAHGIHVLAPPSPDPASCIESSVP